MPRVHGLHKEDRVMFKDFHAFINSIPSDVDPRCVVILESDESLLKACIGRDQDS